MGQISPNRIPFKVTADVYIALGLALLFLPVSWVMAWCAASLIHETAHWIALKLCGVRILAITVSTSGAYIQTDWMCARAECISAAAGPASGIVLVFLGRLAPQIAICAFFQTVFNLLPFHNYDGGRVLYSLLRRILSEKRAAGICGIVERIAFFLIFALLVAVSVHSGLWIIAVVTGVILAAKADIIKIPCKTRGQIVQ